MEVHFTPEQQARVERAAAESRRDPDAYVRELVEHYLDHDLWFRQRVAASLAKLDRGEYLTESAAAARLSEIIEP